MRTADRGAVCRQDRPRSPALPPAAATGLPRDHAGDACPSSADLTRALGDRQLQLSGDTTLLLCEDGRFLLRGLVNGTFPTPLPNPVDLFGSWSIVAGDGGLAIDLSANTPLPRRRDLPIARDAGGGFVVEGVPAADTDATAACGPPPPIVGDTPDDPADPERVLAVTRAITDRELLSTRPTRRARPSTNSSRSAAAARSASRHLPDRHYAVAANDRGLDDRRDWRVELTLEDGLVLGPRRLRARRRAIFRTASARRSTMRGRGDIDLETPSTALLPGNAHRAANVVGGATITTRSASATRDRFALRSDIGSQRTAPVRRGDERRSASDAVRRGSIATVASLALADDGAARWTRSPHTECRGLAFACPEPRALPEARPRGAGPSFLPGST
jgi:hypothetical protein